MAKKNETELRELFGNITYDMIAEQGIEIGKQEVLKHLEDIINLIPTESESTAVKGVWYDRTAEEFKEELLKKWFEEKQKAFSANAFRRKG